MRAAMRLSKLAAEGLLLVNPAYVKAGGSGAGDVKTFLISKMKDEDVVALGRVAMDELGVEALDATRGIRVAPMDCLFCGTKARVVMQVTGPKTVRMFCAACQFSSGEGGAALVLRDYTRKLEIVQRGEGKIVEHVRPKIPLNEKQKALLVRLEALVQRLKRAPLLEEISKELGRPWPGSRSSVHREVATLEERGFLTRNGSKRHIWSFPK